MGPKHIILWGKWLVPSIKFRYSVYARNVRMSSRKIGSSLLAITPNITGSCTNYLNMTQVKKLQMLLLTVCSTRKTADKPGTLFTVPTKQLFGHGWWHPLTAWRVRGRLRKIFPVGLFCTKWVSDRVPRIWCEPDAMRPGFTWRGKNDGHPTQFDCENNNEWNWRKIYKKNWRL